MLHSYINSIILIQSEQHNKQKMSNQHFYNEAMSNTISSPILHCILILIEYYPIFITLITIPLKYTIVSSTTPLLIINFFPFRIIPNGLGNSINLIIFIIIILFLILYIALYYIEQSIDYKQSQTLYKISFIFKIFQCFIINFYDIFFFRYASGYIILFFFNNITEYVYIAEQAIIHQILLFIIFLIFIIYFISFNLHIKMFYAMIHLDNKDISLQTTKYPFDYLFSRDYELILSIIKIIIAMNYFALRSNAKSYATTMILDMIIVLLHAVLILNYIKLLYTKSDIWFFIFNQTMNMTRIHVVFSGLITMVLYAILLDVNTSSLIAYLSIIIVSVIMVIVGLLMYWQLKVKPMFYDGIISIAKIIYIITRNNQIDNSDLPDKYFHINLLQILDSFQYNHRLNCIKASNCVQCSQFYNEFSSTTSESSSSLSNNYIINLYNYLIKSNILKPKYYIEKIYSEILYLFYLHYNKQLFLFYTYQHKLQQKYNTIDPHMVRNINSIVEQCITFYDQFNVSFLKKSFVYSKANHLLNESLCNIKQFINLPNDLRYPDRFFALGNMIKRLQDFIIETLQKINDIKEDNNDKTIDHIVMTAKNHYKYNLTMNRFIVEKITNQPYHKLSPIDIDALEEYFTNHYNNDKILIIAMDLKYIFEGDSSNVNSYSFIMMQLGKEINHFKGKPIIELFPKKFKNHGVKALIDIIEKYQDLSTLDGHHHKAKIKGHNNTKINIEEKIALNINNSTLEHLRNTLVPNEVEYMRYSINISQTLDSSQMVIHGLYNSDNKKIIVVYEDSKMNNQLTLYSFNNSILNVLLFNQEWIEILSQARYTIPLSSLFKSITPIEHTYTSINNSSTATTPQVTGKDYECLFKMSHFYTKIIQYFNFLSNYYEKLNKEKYENVLKVKEIMMNDKHSFKLKMKLSWIFDINIKEKHSVYAVNFASNKKRNTPKINDTFINKGKVIENTTDIWDNEDDDNNIQNQAMLLITANTQSGNSIADGSSSQQSHSNNQKKNKHFNLLQQQQAEDDKLNSVSKTFKLFSWLIVILNTIVLILCIIFLIIEIAQLDYIQQAFSLYALFKKMRCNNSHTTISILSNLCIAEQKKKNCYNHFNDFSDYLMDDMSLDLIYKPHLYLLKELKYKVKSADSYFFKFKDEFYKITNKINNNNLSVTEKKEGLINILIQTMTYVILSQDGELNVTPQFLTITFEEGLRKFLNSITFLTESLTSFDEASINIIKYINDTSIDFNNYIYPELLTELQKEIYQFIINNLYFTKTYQGSESQFMNIIDKGKGTNQTVLIIFMILIGCLNLFLGFLCIWNVYIVEMLFINFIGKMLRLLSDQDFKEYYNHRIDSLISLSKLYDKNPNNVINAMKKEDIKAKLKFNEKSKEFHSNHNSNKTVSLIGTATIAEQQSFLLSVNNDMINLRIKDHDNIKSLLCPFLCRIYTMITLYVILAISFDIILFLVYINVFKVLSYFITNLQLTNVIFDNISLTHSMQFLSINPQELSLFYNETSSKTDGYNNFLLRKSEFYIKASIEIEANYFSPIGSYYMNQCPGFFETLDDNEVKNTIAETKIDYYFYMNSLCETTSLMKLPNFIYIYDEIILLSSKYLNSIEHETYDDLYKGHKLLYKYEIVNLVLVVFKPLRVDIMTMLLEAFMLPALDVYYIMVWTFLCFNIGIDVIMFVYIKIGIVMKLNRMYGNLNLLNDCFMG